MRAIKSEEKNNIRRDNKQHPRKPDIPMYIPPCRLDNVNSEQGMSTLSTGAVAEWIERLPRSREVAGSSPGCTKPKV